MWTRWLAVCRKLLASEAGASMVEYALLLAFFVVLILALIGGLGQSLISFFQEFADWIRSLSA